MLLLLIALLLITVFHFFFFLSEIKLAGLPSSITTDEWGFDYCSFPLITYSFGLANLFLLKFYL